MALTLATLPYPGQTPWLPGSPVVLHCCWPHTYRSLRRSSLLCPSARNPWTPVGAGALWSLPCGEGLSLGREAEGLTAFLSSNSAGHWRLEGGSVPQGMPSSAQDRMKYGERSYTHHVPPWLEGQGFPILPPGDCGLWVAPGRPALQDHLLAHRGHCVLRLDLEILLKDCGEDGGSAGSSAQPSSPLPKGSPWCLLPHLPHSAFPFTVHSSEPYLPGVPFRFTPSQLSPPVSWPEPPLTDTPSNLPRPCHPGTPHPRPPSRASPATDSRALRLTAVPSLLLASHV